MDRKRIIIIIGWLGTAILCTAYAMNAFGYIPSTGLVYSISNLIAALFLGLRVAFDRNWSNVMLEVFFGGVAIIALIKYLV